MFKKVSRNNHKYLLKLRVNQTEAEKAFEQILKNIGVRYISQKGFFKPFHRIYDFYIPKQKIGFEIDGGYHLLQAEKDLRKDNWFNGARGIRTIRYTNERVLTDKKLIDELRSLLVS